MKNWIIVLCTIFIVYAGVSIPVFAEESNSDNKTDSLNLSSKAKSAILLEQNTGKILYDKQAHEKLPPASMTKIMTLLLIMEALDNGKIQLDEKVRISENAASMGGSQIFLKAGEEMTVNNLLKGVAIASGNDASVALAERIAGSEEEFVKKMNEKVKELGLKDTKFQNPTGLPAEDHYSTAYDMAVIAQHLLDHEEITNYTSVYEDYLRKGQDNEFWLVNTNKLVKFYPGVDGLKTGYTSEAKYCLTATAKKNDMRVIAVVMGADSPKTRNSIVSNMLDYSFSHFETTHLYKKGEQVANLNMLKAKDSNVKVVASQPISTVHKKGEKPEKFTTSVKLKQTIAPPLKKGEQVGTMIVKNGNKVLSKTPLIVEKKVESANIFTLFNRTLQKIAKYN
ncbi:D-alanyl-D-alanine carboxypeptidase [Virgibacillus phasianinus]|uniref:serine-type D-Ala-D-Ala carboxypeptidase n=1 Tax=Virgibacillus phasianinus TaxID=2017483 RepID=A0A220U594_9BACI|nr:D-alanyl-D-alanine carboxypeptidase family protein [Virgibacillus phasianinus]ASK63287.1 D-alanyl-D-alanine carboxypeptidase [Virgibacillus phasianinus]